ncbi:MAG: ATP-binding cassette domain-containing protein [Christensenellaceae bacterium]|nr:ATP-binding cassette domain-containing protein [Christensenellaceae bacterium]
MLKLKHITKDYVTKQNTIHVLKDITLNFRECEFVTILGQSGCGKTTLLNIVGGLDRYTSGDIIINGRSTKDFDDRDWDRYRNKQIGFVFQSYNLIPHLNVLMNVELALTLAGRKKEEREKIAMEALRKVGLEDQAYKKPNQMSGGQMQRVAIARALVNNPAIILADEPTGALDSESGEMVMNLLQEVARDRLVIMVSHNAELAAKYSTRTVKIVDGCVVDDTDPLIDENDIDDVTVETEEEANSGCKKKTIRQKIKKSYQQIVHERREERKVSMNDATTIGLSARNLYSKKWRTFLTSFAGSIGVIGISLVLALSTGVNKYIKHTEESALSIYPITITKDGADLMELASVLMEKSKDVKYPSGATVGVNKVAGNLLQGASIEKILGGLFFTNDLGSIKKYLDDPEVGIKPEDGYVKYNYYSSNINIYRKIPVVSEKDEYAYVTGEDGKRYVLSDDGKVHYTKVHPFADSIDPLLADLAKAYPLIQDKINKLILQFSDYLTAFTAFSELISNRNILEEQYDVISGSWPSDEYSVETGEDGRTYKVYDCVLNVDGNNEIQDMMLFAAGLVHPSEVMDMFALEGETTEFFDRTFSEEELRKIEYKVLADCDYFDVDADGNIKTYLTKDNNGQNTLRTTDGSEFIDSHCNIKLRVSGIVRPKKNASASAITGIIGYPHSLIEGIIAECQQSDAVKAQLQNVYYKGTDEKVPSDFNEETGEIEYTNSKEDPNAQVEFRSAVTQDAEGNSLSPIVLATSDFSKIREVADKMKHGETTEKSEPVSGFLRKYFGYAEIENPDSIEVYALSLEGKNRILQIFDAYADNATYNSEGKELRYTDMLKTIMSYVEQMSDAMITALIAFSAVSLIVSSIMIAIITYTSVLERRKEIGVLRSIGARKLDISKLFVSESSIIGLISGVLGIAFGYLLSYIANVIIFKVIEIPSLLHLNWYFAIMLVVISFLLSLIAGIIPAAIAANKDPVECLRSE